MFPPWGNGHAAPTISSMRPGAACTGCGSGRQGRDRRPARTCLEGQGEWPLAGGEVKRDEGTDGGWPDWRHIGENRRVAGDGTKGTRGLMMVWSPGAMVVGRWRD